MPTVANLLREAVDRTSLSHGRRRVAAQHGKLAIAHYLDDRLGPHAKTAVTARGVARGSSVWPA
jgi:hypothetical protein